MLVNAIEGIVQNGQIRLREELTLAENTKVYIIVADLPQTPAVAHIRSPRLARPSQAADFRKQVLELGEDAQL